MDRRFALALAVVVALAAVPAPVAAQETRSGGTVTVEADETVDGDLTAFGGTVVVRGTVDGNLTAAAGNVLVAGQVNGDLEAFAGNVRINGTVTGDASAVGGNVFLDEGGRVDGALEAGAGNVVVEGEVGGDARLGAETVTVGPSAVVGGDLAYGGDLDLADGASVAGEVREESNVNPDVGPVGGTLPGWVSWAYGLLANLVLGAIAVLAFPRFSDGLADRVAGDPLRSGGVGLLLLVGVPVLLVLLAISLVGIPLALVGAFAYAFVLWLGYVYGAFAVGTLLLGLADAANRWLALAVGLVAVSLVGIVPVVGGLVEFAVLLLGLGALALGVRNRYRGRRASRAGEPSDLDSGATA
ncbi:polymer-forming cytoskeletal protein [Halorussus halobius]|uniref:polymer-forming cytoskeletal protein n=1 Tax=Halorussus halobius TaxID=1710537 RepID=UPI001092AAB5|nr:polymer-forming cytoskeletal protein [Halorussus halobius]